MVKFLGELTAQQLTRRPAQPCFPRVPNRAAQIAEMARISPRRGLSADC